MNWKIFATPQLIAEELSQQLCLYSRKETPQHIVLSGGGTPKRWFTLLAQPPWKEKIDWKNIHFWWGDERCVPPENPESNFGTVNELLFRQINIPKENIHRIKGEAPPQQEAFRYDNEIRQYVPKNSEGTPEFDWVHLGMGDDGHTASLFPGQTDYNNTDLATVATHPQNGQQRVSLTPFLLAAAKRISYQVTGHNKSELLQKIEVQREKSQKGTLPWPAANIYSNKGETEWYLDTAAAALLKQS